MKFKQKITLLSPSIVDSVEENAKNEVISKQEEIKMIYLRSFLDRVYKNFDEKDLVSKQYQ